MLEPIAPESRVIEMQASSAAPAVDLSETAAPPMPDLSEASTPARVGLSEEEEIRQAINDFPLSTNPFASLLEEMEGADEEESATENFQPDYTVTLSQLVEVGRAAAVLGGLTAALVGVKATELVVKGVFRAGCRLASTFL